MFRRSSLRLTSHCRAFSSAKYPGQGLLNIIRLEQIYQWELDVETEPPPASVSLGQVSQPQAEQLWALLPTRNPPHERGGDLLPNLLEIHGSGAVYNEFEPPPLAPGFTLATPSLYEWSPTSRLNKDGTDPNELPSLPPEFPRRMWVSGKLTFPVRSPIPVEECFRVVRQLAHVSLKDAEGDRPKLFVTHRLGYFPRYMPPWEVGNPEHALMEEERTHVYLPANFKRKPTKNPKLPPADFEFSYVPTSSMLFQFSALTYNAHKIHLDKEYAREEEGLEGLAVHGPLTALMLLELATLKCCKDQRQRIRSFSYKATNPLIADELCELKGAVTSRKKGVQMVQLWATNPRGVVGMTAEAEVETIKETTEKKVSED
ncbi:hypothetical protein SISNIDRAFT_455673 [Sistotremastrum niveocremeum HHB9708]|uniref:MaoC-like domain-containing protein n=2 Tax=Sistotremastraceae TaxID=3402574 RepID=A0A164TLK6_9AGAM|nr:hypothetical protein SISNIDRAFT_455673 [Sistotremastrum niveocremeum HHB9708]KZT42135.1 hypothetical protein SISSUDRAFT_1041744 [Sistotremastrum suecicum HHB10207 ss-3]